MGNSPGSSSRYAPPVDVHLRPSRALRVLVVGIYLCGALAPLAADLPWYSILAWWAVLLVAGWRVAVSEEAVRVRRRQDGEWEVWTASGSFAGSLVSWFAHPWLCVIRIRDASGGVRALTVARDAVSADEHRRLRVTLRLSRSES